MTDYIFAECPEHGKYMAHQGSCPVCDHNEIFWPSAKTTDGRGYAAVYTEPLSIALEDFSSVIRSPHEIKFEEKWPLTGKAMPESEYRFHPIRRWRFDFAFVDVKLAIEFEGGTYSNGRHVRGSGYEADTEKYNAAIELGWQVLRYTKVNDENIAQIIRVLDKLGQ